MINGRIVLEDLHTEELKQKLGLPQCTEIVLKKAYLDDKMDGVIIDYTLANLSLEQEEKVNKYKNVNIVMSRNKEVEKIKEIDMDSFKLNTKVTEFSKQEKFKEEIVKAVSNAEKEIKEKYKYIKNFEDEKLLDVTKEEYMKKKLKETKEIMKSMEGIMASIGCFSKDKPLFNDKIGEKLVNGTLKIDMDKYLKKYLKENYPEYADLDIRNLRYNKDNKELCVDYKLSGLNEEDYNRLSEYNDKSIKFYDKNIEISLESIDTLDKAKDLIKSLNNQDLGKIKVIK